MHPTPTWPTPEQLEAVLTHTETRWVLTGPWWIVVSILVAGAVAAFVVAYIHWEDSAGVLRNAYYGGGLLLGIAVALVATVGPHFTPYTELLPGQKAAAELLAGPLDSTRAGWRVVVPQDDKRDWIEVHAAFRRGGTVEPFEEVGPRGLWFTALDRDTNRHRCFVTSLTTVGVEDIKSDTVATTSRVTCTPLDK